MVHRWLLLLEKHFSSAPLTSYNAVPSLTDQVCSTLPFVFDPSVKSRHSLALASLMWLSLPKFQVCAAIPL
jgi:hypothetical protein